MIGLGKGGLNGLIGGIVCKTILQHARHNLRGEAAGLLPGVLAAHAVGDEEDIMVRVGHETIFVIGSQSLSTAAADANDIFRHVEKLRLGESRLTTEQSCHHSTTHLRGEPPAKA